MRIAVTADLHLASRDQHPERFNALRDILEQLAVDSVEHLVIAGDLFDREHPTYSDFEDHCRQFPDIRFHVIPGNHDPGISPSSIVGGNVHIYTSPTIVDIGSTFVLFIPYEPKATMGEKIADSVAALEGKPWILVGHGDYYGGPSLRNPLEPGTYMPLSRSNVETFGPQTVFLGHIHKAAAIDGVHYPGSPCGLDISETGRRTYAVFDTLAGSIEARPVSTDILYFDESFVVFPHRDEVALLERAIKDRIARWAIGKSEQHKVCVRARARGYAFDRRAILRALEEGFGAYQFYDSEGPQVGELNTGADPQLCELAQRAEEVIAACEWTFGGDEPSRQDVVVHALSVIYGD